MKKNVSTKSKAKLINKKNQKRIKFKFLIENKLISLNRDELKELKEVNLLR